MIHNAGALALDWERLSLSGYLEAIRAREGDAGNGGEIRPELKRFMEAHTLQ